MYILNDDLPLLYRLVKINATNRLAQFKIRNFLSFCPFMSYQLTCKNKSMIAATINNADPAKNEVRIPDKKRKL